MSVPSKRVRVCHMWKGLIEIVFHRQTCACGGDRRRRLVRDSTRDIRLRNIINIIIWGAGEGVWSVDFIPVLPGRYYIIYMYITYRVYTAQVI